MTKTSDIHTLSLRDGKSLRYRSGRALHRSSAKCRCMHLYALVHPEQRCVNARISTGGVHIMSRTNDPPIPRSRGFSLLEMMITLTIIAISLTIALPSFSRSILQSSAVASLNDLVASLNGARFEALKRGARVQVIANKGNRWDGGWQVVLANDATHPLSQNMPSSTRSIALGNSGTVTFDATGAATVSGKPGNAGNQSLSISFCDSAQTQTLRVLQVMSSGSMNSWAPTNSRTCP